MSAGSGALVPAGPVTVMSTGPPRCAGATAVILVPEWLTVKLAAGVAPKSTTPAPTKWSPLIVTREPPDVDPEVGLTLVITGRMLDSVSISPCEPPWWSVYAPKATQEPASAQAPTDKLDEDNAVAEGCRCLMGAVEEIQVTPTHNFFKSCVLYTLHVFSSLQ